MCVDFSNAYVYVYTCVRDVHRHTCTHMHKYIGADVCCCCSYSDDLMFDGRPAMETKNATLRKRARDPPAAIQPHQPPRIKHAIQQKPFNEHV